MRLTITIDEDVHRRLKNEVPAKGISRFINDALRARLRPGRDDLDRAFKAASLELWRKAEADDWTATEDWPA